MMKKIGLVVDEGTDLTQEIIEKYEMTVVPFKLYWPPEVEKLPGENVFQKMKEADKRGMKVFCKTSQPSPKDFFDAFKRQLENFEKIICITITSKLSGTYNSAVQAKNFLTKEFKERVFVVDSLNGICGEGLLVLKAVDLIKEGKDIKDIVKELQEFTSKIHLVAIVEDPKWLQASGRISSTLANWMRRISKMGVRPLIGVKKGMIKAIGIKTGVKNIPTALLEDFEAKTKKQRKEGKRLRVGIVHCLNIKGAQKLKEIIEKEFKNAEVSFLNLADRAIGSIVGPGSLAIAWCEI